MNQFFGLGVLPAVVPLGVVVETPLVGQGFFMSILDFLSSFWCFL